MRDEGTSYHYAPASEEIAMDKKQFDLLTDILAEGAVDYLAAKVWTTDGFYRETPEKIKRRLAAGCKVVDMECSAVAAWGQYRQVMVHHFFYTKDHVDFATGRWHERKKEVAEGASLYSFFELAKYIAARI